MIKLSDYPLKIKLLLVPAIAVVSFVVYLIYSSLLLSGGDDLLKQIQNAEFPRLYAAGENIKSFDGLLESLKTASSTGEAIYLEEAKAKSAEILHRYDVLKEIDKAHKKQIRQLESNFNSFYALAFVVAQDMANKTEPPNNQQIMQMQVLRNAYSKAAVSYRDAAEKEFQETIRHAIDNSERAQVTGAIIGIFMLFVVGILTMLVNRGIVLLEKAVEDRSKKLMLVNEELEHEIQNLRAAELAKNTAEEASHIKDQFLANMSHELRTPMNAVIGLSHLCLQTDLTEKQQDYVQKINSSAKSLLGILNDILDISKIEAGKMELDRIPFELNEEMENLTTIFGAKLQEKKIDFILQISPKVPTVMIGDPLRLGQVLINLVGNAVKFTSKGEVLVSAELVKEENEYIAMKFTVKDTGIGLSQFEIDKLFRPFTQADSSITRKFGGTGLGLTISKRLVELMGGDIRVDSVPGEGSKFIFTAIFSKATKESYIPQTQFISLRGLRVLVVDDSAHHLESLTSQLTSFSLDVLGASNGRDALSSIRIANKDRRPISLVILKWKMKDIDGLELARELRSMTELRIQPKVMVITDPLQNEIPVNADTTLIAGWMEKPVQRTKLFEAVSNIIGIESSITGKFKAFDSNINFGLISQVRGAHILLVEDNEINQQIAKEMLEKFEIKTTVAENGEEAIAMLKAEQFDGILMDMQMPVMDGVSATREIRKNHKWSNLPIIALTANVFITEKNEFLAAGMNDHVGKPIDPDQLLATLAKWIHPGKAADNSAVSNSTATATATLEALPPPVLPGVKVAESIRRIGGNVGLYYSLLAKFKSSQKNVVHVIRESLSVDDTKTAERIAHTLRGVAGNLGAESLHKQAELLERHIASGIHGDIDLMLTQIDLEISKLISMIDHELDKLNRDNDSTTDNREI